MMSPPVLWKFARPVEWMLLGVMVLLTVRYFALVDDAFIYFRYVDNAVLLHRGLVYNGGEYVEGFTSPLWTLLLMPLRAVGMDYWTMILGLSVICAVVLWGMTVWINRTLSPGEGNLNIPLAVVATHYGVLSSLSSGLETPLTLLAAGVFAALALRPSSRTLQALAGLAPMVRHELAIPWLLYVTWIGVRGRRMPWWLVGSCAASLGTWLVFRVYYYAELLPNTFYLKDGTDFAQGWAYLENAFSPLPFAAVMAAVGAVTIAGLVRSRRGDGLGEAPARLLMITAALVSLVYVLRVGGDMLYFRFAAFAVLLLLFASAGAVEWALGNRLVTHGRWTAPALTVAAATLVLFALPPQLRAHPTDRDAPMAKWHGISDLAWHRAHPGLRWTDARRSEDAALRDRYAHASPDERTQKKVLVTGWCKTAWTRFDAYVVHKWGLTEPVLARFPVPSDRPGHKSKLIPQAEALAKLRRKDPQHRSLGFFERSLSRKKVPGWVAPNLPTLRVLEQKMYNRHRFTENLALALTRPAKLVLSQASP